MGIIKQAIFHPTATCKFFTVIKLENQAVKGENKRQPVVSGATGQLD
jgi:hypothetical protein